MIGYFFLFILNWITKYHNPMYRLEVKHNMNNVIEYDSRYSSYIWFRCPDNSIGHFLQNESNSKQIIKHFEIS